MRGAAGVCIATLALHPTFWVLTFGRESPDRERCPDAVPGGVTRGRDLCDGPGSRRRQCGRWDARSAFSSGEWAARRRSVPAAAAIQPVPLSDFRRTVE